MRIQINYSMCVIMEVKDKEDANEKWMNLYLDYLIKEKEEGNIESSEYVDVDLVQKINDDFTVEELPHFLD